LKLLFFFEVITNKIKIKKRKEKNEKIKRKTVLSSGFESQPPEC